MAHLGRLSRYVDNEGYPQSAITHSFLLSCGLCFVRVRNYMVLCSSCGDFGLLLSASSGQTRTEETRALRNVAPRLRVTIMPTLTTFNFLSPLPHSSLIERRQPAFPLQHIHPVEKRCESAKFVGKSRNFPVIRCARSLAEQPQVKQEDEFDDRYYMRRCVDLAKKAIGRTSPNPMVGCLILKDGKIVGEGFHPKAGQPHAEVFALRDAGDAAENGTAYVTLEPCNHYGRTPPCTEALIKAKVRKVVVGMVDPNPIVASTGLKKLQDSGIEVTVGVEEDLCRRLNEAYIHRMLTGKPFVTLRYSMSLDGFALNRLGEEATELGGYYSKLLQEYDAVILSSGKLSLPVSKEPGAEQPLKVVLWDNKEDPQPLNEASDVTIIAKRDSFPVVSLEHDILELCHARGLCSVLLDMSCGNADFEDVVKQGFEQKLFQKVIVEVFPIIGDCQGSKVKFHDLNAKVKNLRSVPCGRSVLLEGYL